MENWLNTNHLKEAEKICKSCHVSFSGNETLIIKDDGIVAVKYVECSNCKTILVLDVVIPKEKH